MVKTLDSNQIEKIDQPYLQPIYLGHIHLVGEDLYFSDRCIKYNGHDYEDYLAEIPQIGQSIEPLGGFLNLSGKIKFRNHPYRTYNTLLEFFDANPIIRREMDLYVLYVKTGETFGSDVSTKLHRLVIGQYSNIMRSTFETDLSSIIHAADDKNIFIQINQTTWPNAAPEAIGKYENKIYGSLRNIPCHCVQTYAVSTLFLDMAASGETYITLSDIDFPINFSETGVVKIGSERIVYSARDSASKRLTVYMRGYGGTTAVAHKRGSPCWLVESPPGTFLNFKYLVAEHIMKEVSNVYAGESKIRIDPADYTLNLNDSGKTTITFTERQIQKVLEIVSAASSGSSTYEGSHTHSSPATIVKIGIGGVLQWSGSWTQAGTEANLRDRSDLTYAYALHQGETGAAFSFHTYFPAWNGPPITAIYVCITQNLNLTGVATAKLYTNAGGTNLIANLSATGEKVTQKFLQTAAPTTCPTDVYLLLNLGSPPGGASDLVFEIWLEIECLNTGASPASGVSTTVITTVTVDGPDPEVIAPLIICDGKGYYDTAQGTYTGTPYALIENPSDVRRLLLAVFGRSMSEIGASFNNARTVYANRISGGYKFGMILDRIGTKASEIFKKLDEQSRSQLREDGGKFELVFDDGLPATSVMTIDHKLWMADPVFGMTRISEIKNKIRAVYDLDWSGTDPRKKYGDYRKQIETLDAPSIAKYGELALDVNFDAIQVQEMAGDVANWILARKKEVQKTVELPVMWAARPLERGDWFTLNSSFWSGKKWRVMSFEEIPGSKEKGIPKFKIHGNNLYSW